jgi:hypothetical protein
MFAGTHSLRPESGGRARFGIVDANARARDGQRISYVMRELAREHARLDACDISVPNQRATSSVTVSAARVTDFSESTKPCGSSRETP